MTMIVFRVDASTHIGSGHLMRCLALAKALQTQGAEIHFICRYIPDMYHAILKQQGFILHVLPPLKNAAFKNNENDPAHAQWLGVAWEYDVEACITVLKMLPQVDWLMVDHYGIDSRWESEVRAYVKKIFIIDDLADRKHDCDMLLEQCFYEQQNKRYQFFVSAKTLCLLGPQYALLRPEFHAARLAHPRLENVFNPVKCINICFGGMDAKGDTVKALTALKPWLIKQKIRVDVIVTAAFMHHEAVNAFAAEYPSIQIHSSPENVAALLAKADIGLGAVGTMTWERACLGLPSITLVAADNQRQLANDTAKAGVHVLLGESDHVKVEQIQAAFQLLLDNPHLRYHLAKTTMQLTDGLGIQRVVKRMLVPDMTLRRADINDCKDIFTWRNDPLNRRHSHDDREIPFETHENWYKKILQTPDRVILIGSDKNGAVGVMRFDKKNADWLASIYLVPMRHGEGLGTSLLQKGIEWLHAHCGQTIKVCAEIHPDNTASQIIFERAGFEKKYSTFITERVV